LTGQKEKLPVNFEYVALFHNKNSNEWSRVRILYYNYHQCNRRVE